MQLDCQDTIYYHVPLEPMQVNYPVVTWLVAVLVLMIVVGLIIDMSFYVIMAIILYWFFFTK